MEMKAAILDFGMRPKLFQAREVIVVVEIAIVDVALTCVYLAKNWQLEWTSPPSGVTTMQLRVFRPCHHPLRRA